MCTKSFSTVSIDIEVSAIILPVRTPEESQSSPAGTPNSGGTAAVPPIGLAFVSAAKTLNRAFEGELAAAGGSRPVWQIVRALERRRWPTQQDLAAAAGIEGPTLTHHLDRLEGNGMIERSRDPDDRRSVRVELTGAGDELFRRLEEAAVGLDERLRAGLSEEELDTLHGVMRRLLANVGA